MYWFREVENRGAKGASNTKAGKPFISCYSGDFQTERYRAGPFFGIEQDKVYVSLSQKRLKGVNALVDPEVLQIDSKRNEPRVPFGSLLDRGLIEPGELMFDARRRWHAKVRADGMLISNETRGSIHSVGAAVQGAQACNGWTFWHVDRKGNPVSIDLFRQMVRAELAA